MVFFGLFGERRSKGDQFGHDVADTFVPKQLGIREILTLYGSVLPRCLGHAGFGALLSGLLKAYDADIAEYQETFYHPYTLGIFANVLGFSLVMRLQIAYQRLWEGATQCHQASSKWADAVMQVIAFDEASRDAFDDTALEFRMLFIHYASLMHACALIDMRQDDHIDSRLALNQEDPFLFRPNTTPSLYQAKEYAAAKTTASSADGAFAADGAYHGSASSRNLSVPLQMVLITRQNLQKRTGELPCNSFDAIAADEKAVRPKTYAPSTADRTGQALLRRGTSKQVDEPGVPGALPRVPTSPGKKRLKQGEASTWVRFANLFYRNASAQGAVELTRANKFDVVGGVSESEIALLQNRSPGSRVFRVQTWLFRLMTNRLLAGGLAIPPPLLSRTYQVLSDGTAAAVQGRKVAHVEFPFALRQLLAVLLTVFLVLAPMFIAAFMDSVAFCTVLSFFVCLGYTAMNETARELEMPFGLDPNDLNLTEYQRDFNDKLVQLLDQTIPNLGYLSLGRPEALGRPEPAAGGSNVEAPPHCRTAHDGGDLPTAHDGGDLPSVPLPAPGQRPSWQGPPAPYHDDLSS